MNPWKMFHLEFILKLGICKGIFGGNFWINLKKIIESLREFSKHIFLIKKKQINREILFWRIWCADLLDYSINILRNLMKFLAGFLKILVKFLEDPRNFWINIKKKFWRNPWMTLWRNFWRYPCKISLHHSL